MSTVPTALAEQLDVLDVFIESADELLASSFLKQIAETGAGSTMGWVGTGPLQTDRTGPDHESVKALLLTIRFFCQSRTERASIENVNNLVQSLSVKQELKDNLKTSRENFNKYLEAAPSVGFPTDSDASTRWQIFDTLLYGSFAHANPTKRKIVKKWEAELYYNDLRVQFDAIALEFIKATSVMANICREVRTELAT